MQTDAANPQSKTRSALIAAALELFSQKGFDATGTREIAAAASANIAAISYHFGGKDGLRLACAEEIANRIKALSGLDALPAPADLTPDAAAKALEGMAAAVVRQILTQQQARDIFGYVLREFTTGSVALEHVFARLLVPLHAQVCGYWGRATGADPASTETRLAVFSLIGQAVYFRVAEPLVLKRMGWAEMREPEVQAIAATLATNMRAAIMAARERQAT